MPHPDIPTLPATPGVFVPKQERSTRTQAAILDAAREMMSEGGIESLTIAGVAARVGLTTGAFYARFRSKEVLLHALFEETLVANEAAIDGFRRAIAADDAPLAEAISNFVPAAMELVREHSVLFRLFGSDHGGPQSERDRAVQLLEAVIEPIQDLLRERPEELPHPNPDIAAAMLVVMMQGIVDWALLLRQSSNPVVPTQDEELASEIIRALLGYLGLNTHQTPEDKPAEKLRERST